MYMYKRSCIYGYTYTYRERERARERASETNTHTTYGPGTNKNMLNISRIYVHIRTFTHSHSLSLTQTHTHTKRVRPAGALAPVHPACALLPYEGKGKYVVQFTMFCQCFCFWDTNHRPVETTGVVGSAAR